MDTAEILLISSAALFAAGTVKGFVGLGLPTAALALMTLFLDPRLSISLILIPMLATNFWQALRGGYLGKVVHEHWLFAVVLAAAVGASVLMTQNASDQVLLFFLGVLVIAFVVLSWRKLIPTIPQALERPVEVFWASFTGLVGGLTAAWAAPLALYLATKKLPPNEFVQASGFLIAAGTIPLLIAYVAVGHADTEQIGLSAILLLPTLAGFTTGEMLRKRTDPEVFRRILLGVFLILGLNLLSRALLAG